MAKKKRKDVTESGELDMTPMIDIVFNLLIFFMVVTDLTQKDLAELTLPIAYMAQEDKDNDEDDRIILNVDKHGALIWRSEVRSLGEVKSILAEQKILYQKKQRRKGKEAFEILKSGGKATRLFVLLRADKDTPWQHVQWLMTVMAQEKYYKLQFASAKFIQGRGSWDRKNKEQEKLGGIMQKDWKTHPASPKGGN
ncbi:MAG: ExbD/TolR family protein [Planctomycetota bacterium]|jgi:biopolymer transport protein ExbD